MLGIISRNGTAGAVVDCLVACGQVLTGGAAGQAYSGLNDGIGRESLECLYRPVENPGAGVFDPEYSGIGRHEDPSGIFRVKGQGTRRESSIPIGTAVRPDRVH